MMPSIYLPDLYAQIRGKLPEIGDPTASLRKMMEKRPHPRTEELTFKSVSPFTVDKVIKDFKISKSSGLDNMDTFIIKIIRPYVLPAITHIINTSIRTGQFPENYKVAKVVPLYKGKDAPMSQPKSYRPISILPVVSKIIECVIQTQITNHINSSQLFHPNHHAYKTFHSTTTAMLSMHDAWVEAAERGLYAGVVLIDMSSAFDFVDIPILLKNVKFSTSTRKSGSNPT